MPKGLPAARAQRHGGFLFFFALLFHERYQLARDERKCAEDRRQHHAGHGEDELAVVLLQPGSEPALQAEQQHIDFFLFYGVHRERQIDEGDEQALAAEFELGDGPGRREAEHHVERHGDGGDQHGEFDRRQRIGFFQRRPVGLEAAAEGLDEYGEQRHEQEGGEKHQRHADQQPLHDFGFASGGGLQA